MVFKNICDKCGDLMEAPYIIVQEVTTEKDKKYGFKKKKTIGSYHHGCIGFKITALTGKLK